MDKGKMGITLYDTNGVAVFGSGGDKGKRPVTIYDTEGDYVDLSGGGDSVSSVNGQIGVVNLSLQDVSNVGSTAFVNTNIRLNSDDGLKNTNLNLTPTNYSIGLRDSTNGSPINTLTCDQVGWQFNGNTLLLNLNNTVAASSALPRSEIEDIAKSGIATIRQLSGELVPTTLTQIVFNDSNLLNSNGLFTLNNGDIQVLRSGVYTLSANINAQKSGAGTVGNYRLGLGINGIGPQKGQFREYTPTESGVSDISTQTFTAQIYLNANDILQLYHEDTGAGDITTIDNTNNYPITFSVAFVGS